MDRNFVNVLMLGFGFMFLFTSFQTMGNIEKTILDSITTDDPTFRGDGYTSLAIIYACLAICNWLSPSALSLCGPRGAMFIGSLTYLSFMVSFLWPQTWLLYAASAVLGIGAALIWTGQGTYLSRCSTPENISRNSGVFWAMLQASMFLGNLFVYFQFQGKTHIDASTRLIIFSVLIAVAIVGVIFLAMLKRSAAALPDDDETEKVRTSGGGGDDSTASTSSLAGGVMQAFRDAVRLFCTKEMLLLSVTFLYTGLELSFFSGVYSPSIGFTLAMGDGVKQLVGLSGLCIGVGEVSGGVLFGLLGSSRRFGRDMIAMLGLVLHLVSFALIFVNLPDDAPFGDTNEVSYLSPPSRVLALLCSVMLGFGDACFNTQIYSMLGGVFARQSAAAFAIFKFTQSLAAAASFVYSSHVGLTVQMTVLTAFGVVGTVCFCVVEWSHQRRAREEEENAQSSGSREKIDTNGVGNGSAENGH